MTSSTTNVIPGSPNPGGGLYYGDLDAVLPTDAVTALDDTLTSLGIVSSDGVTNGQAITTSEVPDWLGGTVLVLQTKYTETYKVTLIEALNVDVKKLVYGDSNVTSAAASSSHGTQLTVKSTGRQRPYKSFVIDLLTPSGAAVRKAIPIGQVTDVGDVKFQSSAEIGYEVTITAYKDSSGNYSYEYTDDGVKSA